ncbi:TIGR04104 family putative zinc finger protein [Planococcus sp. CAU13]|uniref:TIGR04104 family putative zinc finger protein n=1 Tax=Planococcus sp. CAU13 TaxID=1541197 RepID=UPI0005300A2E|nr:TIGR04104 family putative zinc finger protein [Planococcus sp. CAU13]
MPQCQNCGYKWKARQTLKAHIDYSQGTNCPDCQEEQYVSRFTKMLQGFILLGYIIITFLAWKVFELPTIPFFAIAVSTIVIGIFILIATTKLANKAESVW